MIMIQQPITRSTRYLETQPLCSSVHRVPHGSDGRESGHIFGTVRDSRWIFQCFLLGPSEMGPFDFVRTRRNRRSRKLDIRRFISLDLSRHGFLVVVMIFVFAWPFSCELWHSFSLSKLAFLRGKIFGEEAPFKRRTRTRCWRRLNFGTLRACTTDGHEQL